MGAFSIVCGEFSIVCAVGGPSPPGDFYFYFSRNPRAEVTIARAAVEPFPRGTSTSTLEKEEE